jgi:hypothetical protein
MLTGSSKAGQHKSRRTVETNLEEQKIPKVGRFVAPKNPYFVVAFANHMQYTMVSFFGPVFCSVFALLFQISVGWGFYHGPYICSPAEGCSQNCLSIHWGRRPAVSGPSGWIKIGLIRLAHDSKLSLLLASLKSSMVSLCRISSARIIKLLVVVIVGV